MAEPTSGSEPPAAPRDDRSAASSDWLEQLVAEALEAFDRGGEPGLEQFLAGHPAHRDQVLALITRFRHTGLLRRDAPSEFPERLGEFRLCERLGAGGMGVVFVAEQESLGRRVALKVIRPDLLFFEGARERFRREIEVVARLSHPGIVPIVATGEHQGVPWYAMPIVDGASIDVVVQRLADQPPARLCGADLWRAIGGNGKAPGGSLPEPFAGAYWTAAVQLLRQAAVALHHAHQRGIVHRDLKPSNVMLSVDGRAQLLDFGLALVQGDARLTRTGAEPGSPAYMAPEQLRGLGADERSDVYSLAATLYQLLELAPPFSAADAEALRTRIALGQRRPAQNRSVPRELHLVLAAAMDLDRERRYASAEAFAADLGAVLAQRPIQARRLPPWLLLWRAAQRHRTVAALAAVVVTAAAAWPAAWAWQAQRSIAIEAAAKQRAEAGRDAAVGAVREFLVGLAHSDLISLPTGRRLAGQLLDRAIATLEQLAREAPEGALRFDLLQAEQRVVTLLRRGGRPQEAQARARKLLAAWDGEPGAAPAVALARARLRQDLLNLEAEGTAMPDAEPLAAQVAVDLERAAADPSLRDAVAVCRKDVVGLQALAAERRGATADADRLWQQVLAMAASQGEGDLSSASQRNRYAQALAGRGDHERAAALFREVAADLAPALDPVLTRPEALHVRGHAVWGIAQTLVRQGQVQAARPFYAEAEPILEASAAAYPDHLNYLLALASCLTESGQVLLQLGEPAPGLARLERGRVLFRAATVTAAADQDGLRHRRTNLRVLCAEYGRAGERKALLGVARELASLPPDAEQFATAAWNLLRVAALAERDGDPAGADQAAAEALEALEACDRAGWFPPVDLDDRPCQRLAGSPRFAALRERHPPEPAQRRRR
jgi:serine/threonine protein kinase/tetratricopeptide (TPR) repeat protein